jgi:hypothetical protein
MLTIDQVDTNNKVDVEKFVRFPFQLYTNCSQWVPPLLIDARMYLQKNKHPFFEHSTADFFIATRDDKTVGRIALLENKHYNEFHQTKNANFYFFECENDDEAAQSLFNRAMEWARERNLNKLVGPKGFGALDGYGMVVDGFEHRTIMTMMNYNPDYYPKFMEKMGFLKEVDFISCYVSMETFQLSERIHRIAGLVKQRGKLGVEEFRSRKDLKRWAIKIGKAYNKAFINNWEFFPLTEREIKLVLDNLLTVADPRLIKIISHNDEAVGFIFGFPDLSLGLQKAKGNLFPLGIYHILYDKRRTDWLAVNGMGILPEFQGSGGNALLYSELDKTIHSYNGRFKHIDMTQVAETAVQMRRDLVNLGGKPYKNHRVFYKDI